MKTCSKCCECKAPEAFGVQNGKLRPWCKPCVSAYGAEYRSRNKEAFNEKRRGQYARKNPKKVLAQCCDPGTKTCGKCKKSLELSMFYRHRNAGTKDGLQSRCKECAAANTKEWRQANPERWQEHQKSKALRESELKALRFRRDPEKYKARNRARARHQRNSLRDNYIRTTVAQLSGISRKSIPQPLIEAKRTYLQVLRLIKELK